MVQFDCIEKPLSRGFYVYGRFIARHPRWFLICPLLLTAALGSGIYNFHAEYDVEKLFSPEGARSKDERSNMQRMFPEHENSDNFSAIGILTLAKYGRVIVTTKQSDGNVLKEDVFKEVAQLDKDIRNITVDVDGTRYTYTDLCAGRCEAETDALIILHGVMNVNLNDLSYPVHRVAQGPSNLTFFLGSTIGGVSTTADGDTEAKAWSLYYHLLSYENGEAVTKWQAKFLSVTGKTNYKHITVSRFTGHSLQDELKRNASAVFTLLPILLIVLIAFTVVSCMSADWVRSKPWLGPMGLLSAGLAMVSGSGLVFHTGVPFIDIVAASPFLVLGSSLTLSISAALEIFTFTFEVPSQTQNTAVHYGNTTFVTHWLFFFHKGNCLKHEFQSNIRRQAFCWPLDGKLTSAIRRTVQICQISKILQPN